MFTEMMIMACPALVVIHREVELTHVRFLTVDHSLTLIEPWSAVTAGRRGHFLAELEFHSDAAGPDGRWFVPDMKVFWKLEDEAGRCAIADELPGVAGWEWSGAREVVPVQVVQVDPLSGLCRARLELPVGGNGSGSIRYPHFPEGIATLTAMLGWSERMHLDERGQPAEAVCSARFTFRASWPEVWIGLERPQGGPEIGDDRVEFQLELAKPAAAPRRFTIEAQPPGRVQVLTPLVTVERGQRSAAVRVRGEDLGRFTLRVLEDGVVLGESNAETVVPKVVYVELDAALHEYAAAGGYLEPPKALWFKVCQKAQGTNPTSNPTVELCGPCTKNPAMQPCLGEGLDKPGSITKAGACVLGLDECTYYQGYVESGMYKFESKTQKICGSVSSGVSLGAQKGGTKLGASSDVSTNTWTTCCTYRATSGATKSVPVLDCY